MTSINTKRGEVSFPEMACVFQIHPGQGQIQK